MQRTNIYLPEDQLRALRSLGERRGVPVAELVRQAVAEWLGRAGVRVIADDEWQRRFRSLLERRRRIARRLKLSSDKVEEVVARAVREVRRARAARRR